MPPKVREREKELAEQKPINLKAIREEYEKKVGAEVNEADQGQ